MSSIKLQELQELAVGSDHTDQPSFLTCINEPRPHVALSPVHHCSFLEALLINSDHCRPGTSHKSCSFGDAPTQTSRRHDLPNSLKSLHSPAYPASDTSTLRTKCLPAA
ncbi:hypothetical protein C0J45_20343 [Silurus meridionalis]|nr:hypothetical protein C0J45_20343 [Silurus meridionalis]